MTTKKCNGCGISFPVTSEFFQKRSLNADGFLNKCKKCESARRGKSNRTIEIEEARRTGFRECSDCGKLKPLDEFIKANDSSLADPENKTTLRKKCKLCHAAKQRLNRDNSKKRDIQYHSIRESLNSARKRSKSSGLDFDIEITDLMPFPTHCRLSGVELVYGGGVGNSATASIDKKIPSLGYTKGNVFIISSRMNSVKGSSSIEELEKILEYMKT